ncbi:HesA/MoeB/ThiF family protein [Pseudoalteromonas carrageenovora]|uniref:HesA/MoeB/ThiF family protein n=1 Tax=Pseudoalteromonas carrageenovora TaxID=227 RepID=UPI002118BDA8|nr:HesA/MoeB/ThiF family protein [Pseudoalteromonas carrageenovora]MCQ8889401.1 HesA/MoeB/ThiF family protein [Pseudoalteromonas carrageenovora]MDO6466231.1 HesA/MoeB/ThiF family protein [Pseudoalteromonas carrageenovora]
MDKLSDKETLRYSRHLLLKEVGLEGQLVLKATTVAVVGAGGLGSPALLYLAAAGIGTLILIDDDAVELSNLQRQVLYKVNHLGQSKVTAAGKVLTSLNNQIHIVTHNKKFDDNNAAELLNNADIVLDCSDNFATRYSVNRYCIANKTPLIAGAALATKGQLMGFDFRQNNSPCYGCVFTKSDSAPVVNCSNAGVISPLLGVIGSMQAQLTLNILLGHVEGSVFITFDALSLKQQHFKVVKDLNCKECGK